MGVLMAASVRPADGDCAGAGINDNYQPILPMIITRLGATPYRAFGGKPLYSTIPGAHSGEAGCGTGGENCECACGREYLNELPWY